IGMTLPTGLRVSLTMADYATTKVRQYGDTHVLDRAHGKREEEDPAVVEALVSKLAKLRKLVPVTDDDLPVAGYWAVMMIAHVPIERRLLKLLGRFGDGAYLERYGLELAVRQWEDRYQRGFFTALWLWTLEFRGK
ncbi:MAG: hypothetical protein JWO82_183, partial [Akkermansiaceae bacterium]|nr:hypothetical protein [Akkermansiaceae bacterium]